MTRDAATPLLIGGAAVVALEAARRIFRRSKLFCPTRQPIISWKPEDHGIPGERAQELWFETDDGELLYGWYLRAEKPVASALYLHGNTGNLTNTAFVMPHLLDSGINVLVIDYRGFGRSTGRPSLSGVIDDGICAARLHDKIRPKDLPSIIYGFSLGGAIAAQVIRHHPFDGMILQSTFTNLSDIARVAFPRVPLHLVSGRLFDTVSVLRKLRVPVLLLHGGADEACPAWMADKLHDACGSTLGKLVLIEGGLHKDLWVRDPDSLTWAINRFASDLPLSPHIIDDPPGALDQLVAAGLRAIRRTMRRRPAHQTL